MLLSLSCLFFKVNSCVSKLKLIIKGDIVAAKQFCSQDSESSEESKDSEECEDAEECEEAEDSDMGKQKWTSLQFAEVTGHLNRFLRLKSRECENCGAKPSKLGQLEKPMFGWVRKVCLLGYSTTSFVVP